MKYGHIKLIDYLSGPIAMGSELGRSTRKKLQDVIDLENKDVYIVCVAGISVVESTFAREGVVELIKHYARSKAFIITGHNQNSISFNWRCASRARQQPLQFIINSKIELVGHCLDSLSKEIFDWLIMEGHSTSFGIHQKFNISIAAASGKLKNLYDHGLLLRKERKAKTGGIEYEYFAPLKQCDTTNTKISQKINAA